MVGVGGVGDDVAGSDVVGVSVGSGLLLRAGGFGQCSDFGGGCTAGSLL